MRRLSSTFLALALVCCGALGLSRGQADLGSEAHVEDFLQAAQRVVGPHVKADQLEHVFTRDMVAQLKHRAHALQDTDALYMVGMVEFYGMGSPVRVNAAVQAWMKAGNRGHAQAATNLGVLYLTGVGVPVDNRQAYSWLSKAMAGEPDAHTRWLLGRMLYDGRVPGVDEETALEQAAKLFGEAAQDKHAEAMYMRGLVLEYGLGVDQDQRTALQLFILAGQAGHVDALYHAGLMYAYGRGVFQDFTKASTLFEKAVTGAPRLPKNSSDFSASTHNGTLLGHVGAAYQLGVMTMHGQGVKKDYELALQWFRRAAEQGIHRDDASQTWARQASDAAAQLRPLVMRAGKQAEAALAAGTTAGRRADVTVPEPVPLERSRQQSAQSFLKLQRAVRIAEARAAARQQ